MILEIVERVAQVIALCEREQAAKHDRYAPVDAHLVKALLIPEFLDADEFTAADIDDLWNESFFAGDVQEWTDFLGSKWNNNSMNKESEDHGH